MNRSRDWLRGSKSSKQRGSKVVGCRKDGLTKMGKIAILSCVLEGLIQFESDGVPLPAGLPEATLAKDFAFHRCLDMFELQSIFEGDLYRLKGNLNISTFIWSSQRFKHESKQRIIERLKVIKAKCAKML